MKLYEYLNKNVKLITTNNETFSGKVIDYIPAQDNVPEIASISIGDFEFYENEIDEIQIAS